MSKTKSFYQLQREYMELINECAPLNEDELKQLNQESIDYHKNVIAKKFEDCLEKLPQLIEERSKIKSQSFSLGPHLIRARNLGSKEIIIRTDPRYYLKRESIGFFFKPDSIAGIVEAFVRGKDHYKETLLEHAAKYNKPLAAHMIDMGFEANFGWKDYFKSLAGIKPDRLELAQKLGINEEYNNYLASKVKENTVDIEAPALNKQTIEVNNQNKFASLPSLTSVTTILAGWMKEAPKEAKLKTNTELQNKEASGVLKR